MNRAEAKREAYRRAASCLSSAMDGGWPVWDDHETGQPWYGTVEEGQKVADALKEIIDALDRRGGSR